MSGPVEQFEADAEAFYRDTGVMAPGKDLPAEEGGVELDAYELRFMLWRTWHAFRTAEREIATLRAKLEVCTAYATICAEDLDSPEETGEAFWARFRAAQDEFFAACGITLTPDDTPHI